MVDSAMEDLLAALLLPEPRAHHAWERWRAEIHIDALPYVAQQLLPALNPALAKWLADDPAAGIFHGIARKVWSQNQVRLRKTFELASLLEGAGVQRPAIAGPVAWSLATTAPAIRAIPYLTLLVARADVLKARQALVQAGWLPHAGPPSNDAMDWSDHISFTQENLQLYLHWRAIPARPEDAIPCERTFLQRLSSLEWNGRPLVTLSREATLLHILCGNRTSDVLPWQADVVLTGAAQINWRRFQKLASRFCPLAFDRLQELHGYDLPLRKLAPHPPSAVERKLRYYWNEYRTHSYHRKQPVKWLGFLRFLTERWNLRSMWNIPLFVARRAFQQRRTLAR
jgi:hypothetical protein